MSTPQEAVRQIGRSGLRTALVGLGCNNFGMRLNEAESIAVVHAALDSGYTMFDTSDSYSNGMSEQVLGAALAGSRDDVLIATKFASPMGSGPYRQGASRRHVIQACDASLRRLGTDYIDLYYLHRPDSLTPIEETLDALSVLIAQGKVRYVGSSNFAAWQVADADHLADPARRFIASQFEWSLLARSAEAELVPACQRFGVGIVPYFPLASGLLTGKYKRGEPFPAGTRLAELHFFAGQASPERFAKIALLSAFAADHGKSLVTLAMSWLAGRTGVACVLAGATNADQVRENAAAAQWQLTPEDYAMVDDLLALDPAELPL